MPGYPLPFAWWRVRCILTHQVLLYGVYVPCVMLQIREAHQQLSITQERVWECRAGCSGRNITNNGMLL